jgi:segregation and condensation protein B
MNEKEQDIEQAASEPVAEAQDEQAVEQQAGDRQADEQSAGEQEIVAEQSADARVDDSSAEMQVVAEADALQADEVQAAVVTPVESEVVQTELTPAVVATATQELRLLLEATLLAAGRPVTTQQMLDLFDERDRPTAEELQAALDLLSQDYATRGIELVQVASGWRIQVRPRYVESVSRLWQERPSKYSRALLETLALVAYRQPITRSEIEEIRGVSISSTIMRTLQERNWIRVVGHREVPGRPELLGTTREFLDYFGLRSLDQLPTLAELKDLETIGVQLELPGGKAAGEGEVAPIDVSASDVPATDASTIEVDEEVSIDVSGDDPELSADGESDADDALDEDDDATPTLVASADDERDASRYISDPPVDDR